MKNCLRQNFGVRRAPESPWKTEESFSIIYGDYVFEAPGGHKRGRAVRGAPSFCIAFSERPEGAAAAQIRGHIRAAVLNSGRQKWSHIPRAAPDKALNISVCENKA